MVEVAEKAAEAARKVKNLGDFNRRLERAARAVDERAGEDNLAAMIVYETALTKSGRPREEVLETVRSFRETFEDEEEPLTIAHTSGIMNVEGTSWFFGDEALRVLTGKLLGQFQHRVAQYNNVEEKEVLRRWADGYDTRLFVRRRIFETEPVVGVVGGLDLTLMQHLRVAAGGDTLVPTENVAKALEALGYDAGADGYETLARAESLALHLDLPAPIVGEMLEEIGHEGLDAFEGGTASGEAAAAEPQEPASAEEAAGEKGAKSEGAPPVSGRDDAPGTFGRKDS